MLHTSLIACIYCWFGWTIQQYWWIGRSNESLCPIAGSVNRTVNSAQLANQLSDCQLAKFGVSIRTYIYVYIRINIDCSGGDCNSNSYLGSRYVYGGVGEPKVNLLLRQHNLCVHTNRNCKIYPVTDWQQWEYAKPKLQSNVKSNRRLQAMEGCK